MPPSADAPPGASIARERSPWELFACVAIVMTGVGITLPVLPLYVERLALARNAPAQQIGLHIGLLTASYPLMQLVFAPLWGRLSDRVGRRPLLVIGIFGFVITQLLFGLASGVAVLYAARLLGGALSSALLPVASAYVADTSTAAHRARGMVRLSTAAGLGTLVGPAIGGFLARSDLHFRVASAHFALDTFSLPFFAASALALAALAVMMKLPRPSATRIAAQVARVEQPPVATALLLGAAVSGYLAITMFEATFSLFAVRLGFAADEIGAAFTVCGGMMLVIQLATVTLVERFGEPRAIAIGFALMALGLAALGLATAHALVFAAIGSLGAGMALLGPSLGSIVSKQPAGGTGSALGMQQSAQALGQVGGSVGGVLLFGWQPRAPYVIAALFAAVVGLLIARGPGSMRTARSLLFKRA